MLRSQFRPVALMVLLALALPAAVLAQPKDTADLHGVVLDASGRPAVGYVMKITTKEWGEVIMHPTEDDGTFGATGLPAGDYEIRVFQPGVDAGDPIASKRVTLAAGQVEKIEIRVGSDHAGTKQAPGSGTERSVSATIADNWLLFVIAGIVLAGAFGIFFVVRSQR